ncbi:dihydrofolate reductase family protein [Mucilaginibacter sabulilitoris]|uniref:Dihydrofolate reductase family protein n=1 Tax=Mucilaginibacter sabulilitoris TaxID=1173583 RepID=A0ABZ0TYD4_9SPHI|nr:dihydrofolate reductase family protein [Mucilaginibacter sabulilitoris]WPU96130.1 dihydrofolate reductase family protein [Mucilaginibacter sabulilitoris]
MRKLKLQMNILLGDKWDDEMTNFSIDNLKRVDSIVLGRKTAEGFIPYWEKVAGNHNDDFYNIGRPLHDIPKIVFSKKLKTSKWDNSIIAKGDITDEIKTLKKKKGKDMIVYGGDSFVSSLIQHELIDEFYLLINPVAIGGGKTIFNPLKNNVQLKLKKCKPFPCGVVLLYYTR